MIVELYSIYDNKVEAYQTPMYVKNYSEVMAHLMEWLRVNGKEVNPTYYDLFYLGKYDFNTGKHELQTAPMHKMNIRALATSMDIEVLPDEEEKKQVAELIETLEDAIMIDVMLHKEDKEKPLVKHSLKELKREIRKAENRRKAKIKQELNEEIDNALEGKK